MRSLPALAALALLGGCEPRVTVDLTDGPLDTADEVVLAVTRVALQAEGGTVVTLAVDDDSPLDLLLFQKGQTYRLVDGRELDPGRYTGLALDFAAGDSFATRDDGAQVTINTPVTRSFAPIDLTLDESDEARIVLDLSLRFSLVDDGSGSYDLVPVWRAVRPGDTGTVTGAVSAAIVESADCLAGRAATEGVAVYLFRGSGVTPADYAGQANLIDAAPVELDTVAGEYRYSLHFVPEDDYTLALTCQADADDPAADDAVSFEASGDVAVPAGGTATFDFL